MSSLNILRKMVFNSYPFLNQTVPIILGKKNSKFLHNRTLSNNWAHLSPESYEGHLSCGGNCYLLSYYLEKYGIKTKMMKKSIGYGKYLEDHCYLLHDDSIIIDPTYRQFYSRSISKKNEYSKLLFNQLDFAFIGTLEKFKIQHLILTEKYQDTYGYTLDVDTADFWENPKDISHLQDLDYLLKHPKECKKKGKLYFQLYNYLHDNQILI
jgi:hypothetical protein